MDDFDKLVNNVNIAKLAMFEANENYLAAVRNYNVMVANAVNYARGKMAGEKPDEKTI